MLNWFELFSATECPSCFSPIEQPRRGLRRAFCATCHAALPYRLGLHMDRALHSAWFVHWWRVAVRILRTEAHVSNTPDRKPMATALVSAETGEPARIQSIKKASCG